MSYKDLKGVVCGWLFKGWKELVEIKVGRKVGLYWIVVLESKRRVKVRGGEGWEELWIWLEFGS